MAFDPTITFGAVLNAGVLLVGFVVAFTRIGGRIDLLAQRVGAMEETIKTSSGMATRVAIVETQQAAQASTIAAIQTELADLRRGKGFITSHRQSIDGEYDH